MNYSEVMIATPTRGSEVGYCIGLMTISGLYGGWVPLVGQSDIHMARDTLANAFFNNPQFNTLLWIDSDIGFTRQDVLSILATKEDIVSGLYTTKGLPPTPHCLNDEGQPVPLEDIPPQGMLRTRFVAGGFLKVNRCVLQAITDQKLTRSCHKGTFHLFYDRRIFGDKVMSEDYSFSDLAFAAGFDSWIDCGIRLEHDGRKFGC